MANVHNSNTYYVDTTGTFTDKNVKCYVLIISSDGGDAELALADAASNQGKIDMILPSGSAPVVVTFYDHPAVFPGGVKVVTATNVKATLVVDYTQG